jgi:hypothetical protein
MIGNDSEIQNCLPFIHTLRAGAEFDLFPVTTIHGQQVTNFVNGNSNNLAQFIKPSFVPLT